MDLGFHTLCSLWSQMFCFVLFFGFAILLAFISCFLPFFIMTPEFKEMQFNASISYEKYFSCDFCKNLHWERITFSSSFGMTFLEGLRMTTELKDSLLLRTDVPGILISIRWRLWFPWRDQGVVLTSALPLGQALTPWPRQTVQCILKRKIH